MPRVTSLHSDTPAPEGESGAVLWVDLDSSDPQDRQWLASQSDLQEETRSQLLAPATINHRDVLSDGLLVSLRTSSVAQPVDTESLVSLKILLSPGRVITARSDRVVALDDIRGHLEAGKGPATSLEFFAFVAAGLAERLGTIIFELSEDTDELEEELLERRAVSELSAVGDLRRRISRTRRQLTSLKLVLTMIASDPALQMERTETRTLMKSSDHVGALYEALDDCRARAEILQDQIEAQVSVNMSRSNYNLAIVATVFLPLTFVTGLLGMNVAGIPEAHDPWGFWLVCGALFVFALTCWIGLHWRMRR